MGIESLDHVQLAMPRGREDEARVFYAGALGMTEIEKPEPLRAAGGCWFGAGSVRLHLGVEDSFRPARKAHPALRVRDLDESCARLATHGVEVRPDARLPGIRRVYVDDCFGNRIELIQSGDPDMHA